MTRLFLAPWDVVLPAVFLLAAVYGNVWGIRRLRRGLLHPDHPSQTLWVVEGIRGGIIGLACLSLAVGIRLHVTWPIVVGLIFLGEELLETGIMILALRSGARREAAARQGISEQSGLSHPCG